MSESRVAEISAVVAVVDDDKRIRLALERALKAEGYEVVSGADGFDALRIVKKADILVLDRTSRCGFGRWGR